jgi:hypothetical protein
VHAFDLSSHLLFCERRRFNMFCCFDPFPCAVFSFLDPLSLANIREVVDRVSTHGDTKRPNELFFMAVCAGRTDVMNILLKDTRWTSRQGFGIIQSALTIFCHERRRGGIIPSLATICMYHPKFARGISRFLGCVSINPNAIDKVRRGRHTQRCLTIVTYC